MNLPKEFIEKMQGLLGNDAVQFFEKLDQPSEKGITFNKTRLDKSSFVKNFDEHIDPIPMVEDGFFVNSFKFAENLFNHMGAIYSQEPSAMYPVELLDVKPHDIVLDICASPGGKSIQILSKLNNSGLLVSNEIVYKRAKILQENINKMGYKNSIITCNSPEEFENLDLQFDKILVDAPCGGEGMIRKNSFDINNYNPNAIETNAKRQLSILNSVKGLLKCGGILVYSTCTYDVRENEQVVEDFLSQNPEYEIIDNSKFLDVCCSGIQLKNASTIYALRRYPHIHRGEGQFMVALKKTGSTSHANFTKETKCKGYVSPNKKQLSIIKDELKKHLEISNIDFLLKDDFVYAIPKEKIDLENLNTLNLGCLVGNIQKNILKISHEFYHTYGNLFKNKINLDYNQAKKYIHGEELEIDLPNGIYAVDYLNITIGGGKIVNGKLKNYYKKELRI